MTVCVLGSLNLDLVARVGALPKPGETVLATGLSRHPGGKGLNQAVAAARAGARVRMTGLVGADEAGDRLIEVLVEAGVDVAHVGREASTPTGQAWITVSAGGDNCIVVVAGANGEVAPPPASAIAGARVMLAQLEVPPATVAAAFAARPPGCLAILNAAPALPAGRPLFASCDLLVLNETELAAYAHRGANRESIQAAAQAARGLLTRPSQSVVITLGAKGALLVDASSARHLPGRSVPVVDTVGAGDCFCGVLAAGLGDGLDLAHAVARANTAASLAVGRRGAAEAMPTRKEIDVAM